MPSALKDFSFLLLVYPNHLSKRTGVFLVTPHGKLLHFHPPQAAERSLLDLALVTRRHTHDGGAKADLIGSTWRIEAGQNRDQTLDLHSPDLGGLDAS